MIERDGATATANSLIEVVVWVPAGVWVMNHQKGHEVSIVRAEVRFHGDERSDYLSTTTVKRRKNGEWGGSCGGFVDARWKDAPEQIQSLVMDEYRNHLLVLP